METDPDADFGKALVERGLVRPEHVSECQRLRREMAQRGDGTVPGLGLLLVEKGYLAPPKGRWSFTLPALLATIVLACVIAVLVFGRIRDREEARRLAAEQRAGLMMQAAGVELDLLFMRRYRPDARMDADDTVDVGRQIEEALRQFPRHVPAHILRARLHELRDQRWQAEGAWRAALAIDPSYRPAHLGLALCLLEQSYVVGETPYTEAMRQEAGRAVEEALRGGRLADDVDQTCAEVAAAYLAGNAELARAIAVRGLDGTDRQARSDRLLWLFSCIEPASFEGAIRRCPSHALLYAGRARVGDATRNLDIALQINPNFPEAQWMAGRARRALNREGAIAHYRAALAASPRDWRFRAMVERELAELRDQ